MLDEDTFLANLKTQEEHQEQLSKQQLQELAPKNVPVFDYDNLDLGDLCPKFPIISEDMPDVAPRKPSNITIASQHLAAAIREPTVDVDKSADQKEDADMENVEEAKLEEKEKSPVKSEKVEEKE